MHYYKTAILEEYLSKWNIYHHQLKQHSLKLEKSIKHASCNVSSGKYNLALATEWVKHPSIILSFGLIPKLLHLEKQQDILLLLLDANNSTKGLWKHQLPRKRLWNTGIIPGTLTSSCWAHFSIRQHRLKMERLLFFPKQGSEILLSFTV